MFTAIGRPSEYLHVERDEGYHNGDHYSPTLSTRTVNFSPPCIVVSSMGLKKRAPQAYASMTDAISPNTNTITGISAIQARYSSQANHATVSAIKDKRAVSKCGARYDQQDYCLR